MNNGSRLYNPCSDGFAAKAWECLRRNAEYNRLMDGEDEGWNAARMAAFEHANWFAEAALDPSALPRVCWTALAEKDRETLARTFSADAPGTIERPEKNDRSDWFYLEQDYVLLKVPRRIWDNKQRERILEQIDDLIPKPYAKAQWRKPNGQSLGTWREWESYLLFEEWGACGIESRSRRYSLVADERYGRVNFGNTPAERLAKAAENPKQHRNTSDIQRHVDRILACIKSVFPAFRPMR